MATTFGSLYDYQLKNGIVMPQVSDVKEQVENAFKDVFGSDFSVDAETPQGRLIEAITLLFADVLRVNALNANSFNINQAVGEYLDNLGAVYDVARQTDEGDESYRKRIIESASRGAGYAASVRNAIGDVIVDSETDETIGVNNVVVYDNGLEDPQMLPRAADGSSYPHSIAVAPHSVFISVIAPNATNANIALAIRDSKSAGCGYTNSAVGGSRQDVYIADDGSDADENTGTFFAQFYRPQLMNVKIAVTVIDSAYTGTDVTSDTVTAIKKLMDDRHIADTITKSEIAAAVASEGKGIVVTSVTITTTDVASPTDDTVWDAADSIVIPAYKYINVSSDDITVVVNNTLV